MKIFLIACTLLALVSVSSAESVIGSKFQLNKIVKDSNNLISNELNDFDIFAYIRKFIFNVDKQIVNGFTQAFEKTSSDVPEKCMDDDFQEDFINTVIALFQDIFSGRIFSIVEIYKHILAFSSIIGNELINACQCTKIFPELIKFFTHAFSSGALRGIGYVIKTFFVNMFTNFPAFALWSLTGLGSLITFQGYYAGFSYGVLARIFLYNSP